MESILVDSIVETLATGGPAAILAGFIFLMYRRDRKSSESIQRDDRKFMEDRLTLLLTLDQESREKNTQALTELSIAIRSLNNRKG